MMFGMTRRSSFGISFDNQPAGDYWNRAATFQGLNRGKPTVDMGQMRLCFRNAFTLHPGSNGLGEAEVAGHDGGGGCECFEFLFPIELDDYAQLLKQRFE